MAKAKWGAKRICQNCGAKYYDFKKMPAICPLCQTEFDPEAFMRGRRSRTTATLPAAEVRPEVEPVQDLPAEPVLTPVEDVNEPEPEDVDQPEAATSSNSDVPDDLDLGPEFEDDTAADDDKLLDDDELGDDDLQPVKAMADKGNDNSDP